MTAPESDVDFLDQDGGLNLFAKFKLSIDTLTSAIEKNTLKTIRAEQFRLAQLPNYIPLARMSSVGAGTTDIQDFGGPQPGRVWVVRLLAAFGSPLSAPVTPVYNSASATFGAGLANSLALPVSFESITGFSVNFQGGAAPVSGQIAVTNVVGGSLFYLVTVPTTGLNFQINYPNPLPSTGVAPVVNVPAMAAGPYSITVYGTYSNATAGAVVTWYSGQVMPGPAAGQLPSTMARWQFANLPGTQNFTSDVFKVMPGEHLIAGLTGIPINTNNALIAAVNDQPLYAQGFPVAVE